MPERARPTADRAGSTPAAPAVPRHGDGAIRSPDLLLTGLAPGRLGALWSVPARTWRLAMSRAPGARAALRLYRLDAGDPASGGMVYFIDASEGFLRLDAREGLFIAEVGLLHRDGRMDRLAASVPAAVPPSEESSDCSLAVLDVRNPPPEPPSPSLPAARFLRLFSRGRHPRPLVRRYHGPGGTVRTPASVPESARTPASGPAASPAPSGGHAADADSGWPLALRKRRPDAEDAA